MELLEIQSHVKEEMILDVPFTAEEVTRAIARRVGKQQVQMASWLSTGRLVGIWEAVVIWLLNAVVELEVVADVLKRGLTVPLYKGAKNDLFNLEG